MLKKNHCQIFDCSEDAIFFYYGSQTKRLELEKIVTNTISDLIKYPSMTAAHLKTVRKYGRRGRAPDDMRRERTELKLWDEALTLLDGDFTKLKIIKYLYVVS